MPEIHSTGRGGAGNIGSDSVTYADGEIVREGVAGKSAGSGEYSTGRGGRGNIGGEPDPSTKHNGHRTDAEIVPEPAMTVKHQDVFHTGRGGEGNVHKDKYGGHSKAQSAEHMAKHHAGQGETVEGKAAETHHDGLKDKVKHLFEKK